MSRLVRHPQTSFTGGEIDPTLWGRIDMSRYQSGLSTGRNVRVRLQGGARRRGGTRHRLLLDDGMDGIRTAAFAFNTQQTYTMVFTAGQYRVLNREGALVAQEDGAPWTAAQISTLNWAQSTDTMLVMNHAFAPQRLRRGATESSWTRSAVPLENIPAFDYGAVTPSGTITLSAVSGKGITLTASVAGTFTADMVGWQFFGDGGRARITAFTDDTHVTADVLADFRTGSGTATAAENTTTPKPKKRNKAEPAFPTSATIAGITLWSLEEPVISATRGWPACGDFHLGRLWLGGFKSRPSSLMGSVVGDYFDFDQGEALDDQAIYVTIDSRQINAINQIVSGRTLQVFTAGAEFADASGAIITPRTIDLKPQSSYGTDPGVRTTDLEGATLFAQAISDNDDVEGSALRQFIYGDIEQAWASELISFLSGHLIDRPTQLETIVGRSGTDGSNALITNSDGTLTLLTIARDQQIVAFTNWDTQGLFKSTSCLRSGQVFMAVERDGTMRIEQYDENAMLDASVVAESATEFDDVINLFHLAGMEVGIILDDIWAGTGTVTAEGTLHLPRMCTKAEIGLTFTPVANPMPYEPRDVTGNMIGRKCRLVELSLRVHDTGTFTVNGNTMVLRGVGAGNALDTPPAAVTRDVVLRGLTGWKNRHIVEIAQPIPGPFELLAMSSLIQIGGR